MAMGQQFVTNLLRMAYHFVGIPEGIQSAIAFPAIGTNHTALDSGLLDSFLQVFSRSIRHTSKSNSTNTITIYLRCYHHQALSQSATSSFARLFSSHIGLVHLDFPRQSIPARSDHGPPQFVKPIPCGFIAPKPQYPLQAQCTVSRLLTGNPPNRPNPHGQRLTCAVKNRPSCYGRLVRTDCTLNECVPHSPAFHMPTARTEEAIRPAQTEKVIQSSFFHREASFKFCECLGIVFHTQILHLVCT